MPTYYRNKQTGKTVAKFTGCVTNSAVFTDTAKYERFENVNSLLLEVEPTPSPIEKSPLELRVEALENEVGITAAEPEKESWIDKLRALLHI